MRVIGGICAVLLWSGLGAGAIAASADKPGIQVPAYVILSLSDISDGAQARSQIADVTKGLDKLSGQVIANDTAPSTLQGLAPGLVLVLKFDGLENVQDWKLSDAFKTFDGGIGKVAKVHSLIVEGVQTPGLPPVRQDAKAPGAKDAPDSIPPVKNAKEQIKEICKGC